MTRKPKRRETVSEARASELIGMLHQPKHILEQCRLLQAVLAETRWYAVELSRRDSSRRWNDVCEHVDVLALEPEYQAAVAAGELTVRDAYELYRVPAVHRPQLFAAFKAGKSRRAVRLLARQLAPMARAAWP